MDMKTISLLNLKGGVAKSFTAVNMAYELWCRGKNVLLWDNDKRGISVRHLADMMQTRRHRLQGY